MKRLLLTSFDIWLPHHKSNSSDDLLEEVTRLGALPHALTLVRKLPVDVKGAVDQVIAKIRETQPDYIICCGMAESRSCLSVESNARSTPAFTNCSMSMLPEDYQESRLHTSVNLEELVAPCQATEISHDCGKFVCEGLYYSVLDYLHSSSTKSSCIFIHVPVLTESNIRVVVDDFLLVIDRLALSER
ncbi:MAG: peptidase C15 [Calothrix sp. FI2-JRJ7]|jgi:pyroglutamyl-peptidase|nr:peptidase C15 [Calothrix sp. FI2-JRJ7]